MAAQYVTVYKLRNLPKGEGVSKCLWLITGEQVSVREKLEAKFPDFSFKINKFLTKT